MSTIQDRLEPHRRHIWGVCYRMTGSPAEAEDLVQDTFERALQRPPPDLSQSLRPWLTKVALNLGRDALRRRQRMSYPGPWLPAPFESAEDEPPSVEISEGTAGRYDLMESVTLGFLVALEALTPKQRAVLLLRDVFDYSGAETAEALALSTSDVKVSLHRARNRLADYDARRPPNGSQLSGRTRERLGELLLALGRQDHAAVYALVAEEARVFTDSGGEFISARRVIRGREAASRFLLGLAKKRPPVGVEPRVLNGAPAFLLRYPPGGPRDAPRAVVQVELDAKTGRLSRLYTITSTQKLAQVR